MLLQHLFYQSSQVRWCWYVISCAQARAGIPFFRWRQSSIFGHAKGRHGSIYLGTGIITSCQNKLGFNANVFDILTPYFFLQSLLPKPFQWFGKSARQWRFSFSTMDCPLSLMSSISPVKYLPNKMYLPIGLRRLIPLLV